MTSPGIDPVTVRLVAQRLNHYATPGPRPRGTHIKFYGKHVLVGAQKQFISAFLCLCFLFVCL